MQNRNSKTIIEKSENGMIFLINWNAKTLPNPLLWHRHLLVCTNNNTQQGSLFPFQSFTKPFYDGGKIIYIVVDKYLSFKIWFIIFSSAKVLYKAVVIIVQHLAHK